MQHIAKTRSPPIFFCARHIHTELHVKTKPGTKWAGGRQLVLTHATRQKPHNAEIYAISMATLGWCQHPGASGVQHIAKTRFRPDHPTRGAMVNTNTNDNPTTPPPKKKGATAATPAPPGPPQKHCQAQFSNSKFPKRAKKNLWTSENRYINAEFGALSIYDGPGVDGFFFRVYSAPGNPMVEGRPGESVARLSTPPHPAERFKEATKNSPRPNFFFRHFFFF